MSKDLILASQRSIAKGSKSFAMASIFFDRKTKWAAWHLYSWCRLCDDQIDQATSPQEALNRLQDLKTKTAQAFQSRSGHEGVFEALSVIAHEYRIPEKYAFDLLRGMEMDVSGFEYKTTNDLLEYCYCVAGTVGLMMCHVMGLTDSAALKNAVHMGLAMQMTNIARDVEDDLKLKRIYFPLSWLKKRDLSPLQFAKADPATWASLARELVKLAEAHYQKGYAGLAALPPRAAWAVLIAAEVYSKIGHKVVQRGAKAWTSRCYVTGFEKMLIAVRASFKMLRILLSKKSKESCEPLTLLNFQTDDYAKVK
jgi:phytoene synthase